jgi:hypothetical protein
MYTYIKCVCGTTHTHTYMDQQNTAEPPEFRGSQEFLDLTNYTDASAILYNNDKRYNAKSEDQQQCCAMVRTHNHNGMFTRCRNRCVENNEYNLPRYCAFHVKLYQRSMGMYKNACAGISTTEPRYNPETDTTLKLISAKKTEMERCLILRQINKFLFFQSGATNSTEQRCVYDDVHNYYLESLEIRVDALKNALNKLRSQNLPPVDPSRVTLVTGSHIHDPASLEEEVEEETEPKEKEETEQKKKPPAKQQQQQQKKKKATAFPTKSDEIIEKLIERKTKYIDQIKPYYESHKEEVYDKLVKGIVVVALSTSTCVVHTTKLVVNSPEHVIPVIKAWKDLRNKIDDTFHLAEWNRNLLGMALSLTSDGREQIANISIGTNEKRKDSPKDEDAIERAWTTIETIPSGAIYKLDGVLFDLSYGVLKSFYSVDEYIGMLDRKADMATTTTAIDELYIVLDKIMRAQPFILGISVILFMFDMRGFMSEFETTLVNIQVHSKAIRPLIAGWKINSNNNSITTKLRDPKMWSGELNKLLKNIPILVENMMANIGQFYRLVWKGKKRLNNQIKGALLAKYSFKDFKSVADLHTVLGELLEAFDANAPKKIKGEPNVFRPGKSYVLVSASAVQHPFLINTGLSTLINDYRDLYKVYKESGVSSRVEIPHPDTVVLPAASVTLSK